MSQIEKESKEVEKALEILHSSAIGQAVMINLRDHANPSEGAIEMNKETNKRINSLVGWFIVIVLSVNGGVGYVNWAAIDRGFANFEKVYDKLEERVNRLEEKISNYIK